MKRKLDLIDYGWKIVVGIGLFAAGIPLVLFASALLLNQSSQPDSFLMSGIILSWKIAAALFGILIVLLIVEQIQDHLFDRWYRQQQEKPLRADGPYLECQYCGSRKIHPTDHQCPVCGKDLAHS